MFKKCIVLKKCAVFEKMHSFFQIETNEKGWSKPLPLIMELYFLDDGSLIITKLRLDKVRSTTLIAPDQFEVVRNIGSHYLSHLSGKEAYDFLVEQNPTLAKNGLSKRAKSKERMGT